MQVRNCRWVVVDSDQTWNARIDALPNTTKGRSNEAEATEHAPTYMSRATVIPLPSTTPSSLPVGMRLRSEAFSHADIHIRIVNLSDEHQFARCRKTACLQPVGVYSACQCRPVELYRVHTGSLKLIHESRYLTSQEVIDFQ